MNTPGLFLMLAVCPPGRTEAALAEHCAGLADPVLDLRYGTADDQRRLAEETVGRRVDGLTVCVDAGQEPLLAFLARSLPSGGRIILSGLDGLEATIGPQLERAHGRGIAAGVEVGGWGEATRAAVAGADFLVVSGVEAGGPVSAKTTLVLLQELLGQVALPVLVRGSLGPRGAAAAYAMGCAGCLLDTQLLLAPEAGLGGDLIEILLRASPSDTVLAGELAGRPYRFLAARAREESATLVRREQEICRAAHSWAERCALFQQELAPAMERGFATGAGLLAVGQGIAFARQFAAQGMALRDILELYRSTIREAAAGLRTAFSFREGSPWARRYGIRYPVVQGPMAGITGNARLAEAVAEAGGLPFLAATGLTPEQTADMLAEGKRALGERPFGMGIVGFSRSEVAQAQEEIALANAPRCVTFAGGDPARAKRLEDAGIDVYFHTPTQSHIRACLDAGVHGIILEGHEAGGHVGALGSLVLWELAVQEVLQHETACAAGVRVLFAGGMGNARGALAAAVVAAPLAQKGVLAGLQLGTAYLLTREALDRGAIPAAYQIGLLGSGETVVAGRTVNLPSRWLKTDSVVRVTETEFSLVAESVPLSERKRVLEVEERRLAAEAMKAVPSAAAGYSCGQGIALRDCANRIADLHEELTAGAERLASQVLTPEFEAKEAPEPVAIVGMGCIFPDAHNPSEFWNNILNKVDSVREAPKSYLDADLYYDPDRRARGKSYTKMGAFIEGFRKDSVKFRIPPVAEPSIDAVQYLALEVTYQALVDAGYVGPDGAAPARTLPRDRTAVVVGCSDGGDLRDLYTVRGEWPAIARTLESVPEFQALPESTRSVILQQVERGLKRDIPELTEDSCPGVLTSLVAGRIGNCFDLRGGATTVDAACASSLAAIDTAVAALRDRRADVVLAGGVCTRIGAGLYILFSALGALSPTGSFPFDERADGFVLSQGGGMVVLKRLEDAQRDGDRIYAVIRGIGSSSDGRVKGITAPDVDGQMLALERAYLPLPFGPETLDFVEAHATGTGAGDIAELTSLTRFVKQSSNRGGDIAIGAVKSNIGHAKAAAGMAGLIKTALALHHGILPPSIHCEQPRRDFDWDDAPFYLVRDARSWPVRPHPRRAAVNAFGFGGLNYHAVLEQAPQTPAAASAIEAGRDLSGHWLLFRAASRGELIGQVERARAVLAGGTPGESLCRVSEPGPGKRAAGPTLAVVAADPSRLSTHLDKALKLLAEKGRTEINLAEGIYYGEQPLAEGEKVAFVFPGQGSQYPGMCGDLPSRFPAAALLAGAVDTIAQRFGTPPLLPLLCLEEAPGEQRLAAIEEALHRPDYNHPAMLAVSAVLVELLARAGVRPDMAAGHSLGEYMALYAAGVFDLEQIVRILARRGGGIAEHCFHQGIMGVVHMSGAEAEDYCARAPGMVAVANKNCPAQTVVSGEEHAVQAVLREAARNGIRANALRVSCAFHTPLLEPAVAPFRLFLDLFEPRIPAVPVQCNLTGRAYETSNGFPARLRDTLVQHMVRPVEFIRNVESMYDAGARIFLEVGPGAVLCSFIDSILGERPHLSIPTNLPKRPASLQLLHALAACAARGLPVNLDGLRPGRTVALVGARRPQFTHPPPKMAAAPSQPGLIEKALAGEDPALVREYLDRFSGFLQQFARLDFQRYATLCSPSPAAAQASPPSPEGGDDLARKVVAMVARKTGYPAEMIGLDLDVEAELGLDSIKQVEIVRELAEELGISSAGEAQPRRYRISTLRQLTEELRSLAPGPPPAGLQEPSPQPVPDRAAAAPAYGTDCRRWVCELVEAPAVDAPARDHLSGRNVLLLATEGELASAVRRELAGAGGSVTLVFPETFRGELPGRFDVVVDLLGFGASGLTDGWWRETERRAEITLLAAQRLAAGEAAPALWIEVTALGGDFGAAAAPEAGFAGVGLGLSRCLAAESEGRVETLYVDFDGGCTEENVARRVVEEAGRNGDDREVGYRAGRRLLVRWVPQDLPRQTPAALARETIVLAVGGARGVTAQICLELAARGAGRFLIAGRTPEPTPSAPRELDFQAARDEVLARARASGERVVPAEVERRAWESVWEEERRRTLDQLRQTGAEVIYVQCDVSDGPAMERLAGLIKERYGRLDLVVQGSGAVVNKSIVDFAAPEFIRAMKGKALGTALLLRALEAIPVGTFINVSSVVGRWGNGGQSAYAAGHEVAAALVAGARRRPGRWLNLYYGPWLDVGMTRVGEVMERLRERHTQFLTPQAGGAALADEHQWGNGVSVALCGEEIARGFELLADLRRAPFLDHARRISPSEAEGRRTFDPQGDRFVADHAVSGSGVIVPGAATVEMIAQTAGLLAPRGWEVTDVEDVEFPRPVRFPRGEAREVRSRAQVMGRETDGIWFRGEAFSLFHPPGGGAPAEALHARCRIRFGRRLPGPLPTLVVPAAGLGNAKTDLSPLYGTPDIPNRNGIYRTSQSIQSVTPDGVWAEVSAPCLPAFGSDPHLGNPVRLDGVLFLPHLAACAFEAGSSYYVKGVRAVRFYQTADRSQESARRCRSLVTLLTREDLISDTEAVDAAGRVAERVWGMHNVLAHRSGSGRAETRWHSFREHPRQQDIRRLLGVGHPLALAQAPAPVVQAALEQDAEALIARYLCAEEREVFCGLTHPKRRREWLSGRVAAKAAARLCLDPRPDYLDMSIETGEHGAPRLRLARRPGCEIQISISHSGEISAALASARPGFGIDVETRLESIEDLAEAFSEPSEEARLAAAGGFPDRGTGLAVLWCLKEACFKARTGNLDSATRIRLESARRDGDYLVCTLAAMDRSRFSGVAFVEDGRAFAVVEMTES